MAEIQTPGGEPAAPASTMNSSPPRSNGRAGDRARPPGPEQARRGASGPQRSFPPRLSWPWVLLLIFLAVNYFVAPIVIPDGSDRVTIPYTTFKEQVQRGNVQEITTRGEAIQGVLRSAITWPVTGENQKTSTKFDTRIPSFPDPGLETMLEQNGVVINARPPDEGRGWLLTLLLSFGPGLLFFGLLMWMFSRAQRNQGGVFSIGRSKARRYAAAEGVPKITFADVAGIDEAENELVEIVDFLKNPDKYQRLGGSIPKGVLLVGSPGTGKTLLAKAVAGEANVPFFSMSGSEFIEMIVGVGASRVRDLFENAKKEAPAIIFVDELDAIGRRRGGMGSVGSHEEREQTLNQLLVEMDGFDARQAVIVLAATNRPDVLDPALLRPGRFDRRVVVQRPDKVGREKILRVHTRGVPLAPDVDLAEVAQTTPGLVGADLRNLVNEAALLAARRERNNVTRQDFFDAMEKIVLGPERALVMNPEDRRRVAYHESGHALVGLLVPEADPVQRVTIVPRGQALGVTYSRPDGRHRQLHRAVPARPDPGGARRPDRRGADLQRHLDRRRERHQAGDQPGPPDGGPLGHEPEGRPDLAGRRRGQRLPGRWRGPGAASTARRWRASSTRRRAGSSTRATSRRVRWSSGSASGSRRWPRRCSRTSRSTTTRS